MRRMIIVLACVAAAFALMPTATAHGDYFNYPCNYPFVGTQASVDVIVYAGGQYCDGPMEINGSHYHCESGGGGIGGGAIGLAPLAGLTLGGFGGSGIGGAGGRCQWECPDKTVALPPNPPAAWIQHLVLQDKYNDCRDHMAPAGMDSAPQAPESGPAGKAPADAGGRSPIAPGSPMELP